MEMTHLRLNSKNLDSEAVIGSETALVTRPINRPVFFLLSYYRRPLLEWTKTVTVTPGLKCRTNMQVT